MKLISQITNGAFEAEFLKTEWYKNVYNNVRKQYEKIVLEPDINSLQENIVRKQLLWQSRYPLLQRLPNNITWHIVAIAEQEFERLLVIRETGWESTFGKIKTLKDVAQAIIAGIQDRGIGIDLIESIKKAIGNYPFEEKLICIATKNQEPLTILEGNHRAVAFQLRKEKTGATNHIPKKIMLGISPTMGNCPWLNFL